MTNLVTKKEKVYFVISLIVSIGILIALIISVVGLAYLAILAVIITVLHGIALGTIRANGVRVSERQFPEIDRLIKDLAGRMELLPPPVYIMQASGTLNAFATRFLRRDFVVVFADVLEVAYEKGESAVAFVLAHELAHVKCKHVSRRFWLAPAMLIPFLGKAYSRACESTCDRYAAHYQPDGVTAGLFLLSVGKALYRKVDLDAWYLQAQDEHGFWISLAEIFSSHPHLRNRLLALRR